MTRPVRILHLHSSFSLGGKEARAVRLMNAWEKRASHCILSGVPGQLDAREAIAPGVATEFPERAPALAGRPSVARYWRLACYMQGFDLVLSYNWGAMDAVMAHRLFAPVMKLPALIHHEDGFNSDEAEGLKSSRNQFRHIGLGSARALVVPSTKLERIALCDWRQPRDKVRLIRNGIDVARYAEPPATDAIPDLIRSPGKLLVGTLAGLRPVKNLRKLVRAVAAHNDGLQLVIVGEGPERQAIVAEALAHGLSHIHLPGFMAEPFRFIGLFDLFALSSDSEQFPISLVEAMAAGLAAVATDVGDVAEMVAAENRPFIVPVSDETAFTAALERLSSDSILRSAIGAANRNKAVHAYAETQMIVSYAALYGEALGRPDALL
ncbi:MAG TPA: glycosyltransferase family 4 protein [Rhizorhapis sp.]|nr:glycosyltransferase family 4 protein [Rhizorhapis sp.]